MSAREPLAVPPLPQARTRAGMTMETAMDTAADSRRGKANCEFCGHVWFGEVAYCPYCGRAAADRHATVPPAVKQEPGNAASASAADERATAPADPPGMRWKVRWKTIVTAAMALAFVAIAIAVKELAVTTSDRAGPPSARRAPAFGAAGNGTFEASDRVAAPRAAPAPQAPNRSLCSAANEAAGLCKPQ